ncbi:MAG TPA: bifunctional UDP-N-acetylglucosamine diphosphorylase/glucosamine-1-phosphate N-acetyltransferase GlmU [Acidimicrobiia bacterium]
MATEIRPVSAVVLAAGEGTRMRSTTPKVLHPLCGRPMLLHVLDALERLPLQKIVVVVGHAAEHVTKTLQEQLVGEVPVEFVEQHTQRGTGDAASVALTAFADDPDLEDDLIVVAGDVPLLRAETLARLATEHRNADAAASLLTAHVADPTGYGRVVRDDQGRVDRIVEQSDGTPDELTIDEVNPSIYCFRRGLLAPALRRLSPENAQGEYYLTDVVAVLRQAGHLVLGVEADDATDAFGVNDRAQLAEAEAELRHRINTRWMRAGVGMTDPARTYVDTGVVLAPDVLLLPGTMLSGRTVVGTGSVIGPDCQLIDTVVGDGAVVRQTVARDSVIGDGATVGPYASLRPGTRLAAGAHVGTFVEIKNSEIGEGAKVPHLAYVGDAEIGPRANIGAGNITANYDGKQKHRTIVGADARTGSNTVLVAPVEVGDGAYTAAGAVVTRDVPPGALAKGVPASIEEGWVARREDARTDDDGRGEGDDEEGAN